MAAVNLVSWTHDGKVLCRQIHHKHFQNARHNIEAIMRRPIKIDRGKKKLQDAMTDLSYRLNQSMIFMRPIVAFSAADRSHSWLIVA